MRKNKTTNKGNTMITIKKSAWENTYDFIFQNKIIGQIEAREEKVEGVNDYDLKFWDGYGFQNEDAILGFKEAKEIMKKSLISQMEKGITKVENHPEANEYYKSIKEACEKFNQKLNREDK
jgi:hypothetical protein